MNPATTAGLVFNFDQPLLRGFGIAVNNRYIRIARNNRNVSDLVFEEQLVSTAYAVARLYWDLVALRSNVTVQRDSVDLAERLVQENTQQEEIGTLAPIEVVRARAQLASARRDLTVAETRLRQQETVLKDYLTRGTVDAQSLSTLRLIPTDTIVPPAQDPVEPLQDLVAEARKKRPEIAGSDLQIENARITAAGSKSALSGLGSGREREEQRAVRLGQSRTSDRKHSYDSAGAHPRSCIPGRRRHRTLPDLLGTVSRLHSCAATKHPADESGCPRRLHARPARRSGNSSCVCGRSRSRSASKS